MQTRIASRHVILALLAVVLSGSVSAARRNPSDDDRTRPGRGRPHGSAQVAERNHSDEPRTPSRHANRGQDRGRHHTVVLRADAQGCDTRGVIVIPSRHGAREHGNHDGRGRGHAYGYGRRHGHHHGYRDACRWGTCIHFAGHRTLVVRRLSHHSRIVQPRIHGHDAVLQTRDRRGHEWITVAAHLSIW